MKNIPKRSYRMIKSKRFYFKKSKEEEKNIQKKEEEKNIQENLPKNLNNFQRILEKNLACNYSTVNFINN